LITGTFISVTGDSVASLSMILDAAAFGKPWWVTEVFFAELLPPLALAPLLGVLVDRTSAKNVWMGAILAQALIFGAAAVVPEFHARVALVALANVFAVASSAAVFKLVPTIAGETGAERANSGIGTATSLAFLAGPGIGGAVYVATGSSLLLGLNAASFLLIAAVTGVVVPNDTDERMELDTRPFEGAREGFRVLRASPVIGPMLPILGGVVFATSVEGVAGVFYLREVAAGDSVYGLLLAAWALGSVPGALAGGWQRVTDKEVLLVAGGALSISIALLVEGLVPIAWVIAVVFVIGGFGNGAHNVGVRSAIHRHIPARAHGRAWSYYSVLANSCVALGYVVGTPGVVMGSRPMVIVSGVLALSTSLLGIWFLRRVLLSQTKTENRRSATPYGKS
jgi:MFS family permease